MSDMELRYAHLGHRRTPAREAQRAETVRHIAEIQAEQLARLDAKFRNLGAAKERVDATRHHSCPKCGQPTRFKQWPTACLCGRASDPRTQLTNSDHLVPTPSRGGPALPIAARYSTGRIPTTP